jgi:hypothetical protein
MTTTNMKSGFTASSATCPLRNISNVVDLSAKQKRGSNAKPRKSIKQYGALLVYVFAHTCWKG